MALESNHLSWWCVPEARGLKSAFFTVDVLQVTIDLRRQNSPWSYFLWDYIITMCRTNHPVETGKF